VTGTRQRWGLIAWAYLAVLLTASNMPVYYKSTSLLKQVLHNAMHIPAYFILTWILLIYLNRRSRSRMLYAGVIAVSMCFGVTNEIVQSFVPGRDTSLLDVGLNLLGTLLAVYTFHIRKMRKESKNAAYSIIA